VWIVLCDCMAKSMHFENLCQCFKKKKKKKKFYHYRSNILQQLLIFCEGQNANVHIRVW